MCMSLIGWVLFEEGGLVFLFLYAGLGFSLLVSWVTFSVPPFQYILLIKKKKNNMIICDFWETCSEQFLFNPVFLCD